VNESGCSGGELGGYDCACTLYRTVMSPEAINGVSNEGQGMEISDWRYKIDELDEQIVQLISQRAEAARAIGELKRTSDLPVYEPKREQAVFDHVRKVNPGPLGDAELLHVYERIIDVMRTLQRRDI
jgi:chorismate mutase